MNITRNVIIDLLPLYLAEEASEDTRQLVEAFLATDPSLSKLAMQSQQPQRLDDIPHTLNKEHALKTLEKAKGYSRQRNLFMSMGFLFTGLLLAFRFDGSEVTWLWNGTMAAFPVFVLALFSWTMFTVSVGKLSLANVQELIVQRNVFLGLAIVCSLLFALLLGFANLEPINSGILYFLFFFAFVGWVGFADAIRRL